MTYKPYSYRSDPAVPKFDDSAPLIIFDGYCVLCSAGVQWMMARDRDGTSRFAAVQGEVPRAIYRHYGLDPDAFETFMVLAGGVPYIKWIGVLAAGRTSPRPWSSLAAIGRAIPNVAGDRVYDWVQHNRFRWFGRRDICSMPNVQTGPNQRSQFL
jgi:predicted DCC family thiol-disulfide oxidoreductase YuxK